MNTKTLYLTFKVEIVSNSELTHEDVQQFIDELDYEIMYCDELQDKINYLTTELEDVKE